MLYVEVPDEELVERLSARLVCRECQVPFHRTANPFRVCPHSRCTGEHLYQRTDDAPETVRARLVTFHRQTAPVIDYYRLINLLVTVPGNGPVDEVKRATLEAVRRVHAKDELMFEAAELGRTIPKDEYKARIPCAAHRAARGAATAHGRALPGHRGVRRRRRRRQGRNRQPVERVDGSALDRHARVRRAVRRRDASAQSTGATGGTCRRKGRIGLFLSSWYSRPILDRVYRPNVEAPTSTSSSIASPSSSGR